MGRRSFYPVDQDHTLFRKPPGAERFAFRSYYKRGQHGFIYRWSEVWQEWVKSDISEADFARARRV